MRMFKYAVVGHFAIGLYMYSNESIIPHGMKQNEDGTYTFDEFEESSFIHGLHMYIFLIVGIIYVVGLLLKSTVLKVLFRIIKDLCKVKDRFNEDETLLSDDFYK
eukprot:CAMPEP_0202980480 /NCGR_PEP_ID=MMETSP1396-20130829/86397_1 /ASSEMBLY_ACC=CAM_ASM_000872 /TAXON_ID= /ORGANISM="Pseudokeronopsis sp., Strain Brazil" /LENGTH=104 /DNA_ID=CAMNT_0049720481 /DNA_START=878 /DNA_END=1192 /DNA_ORIENTATION=-